jgi:hypothetical protein
MYGHHYREVSQKEQAMTGNSDHISKPSISARTATATRAHVSRVHERVEPAFLTTYKTKLRIEANGRGDKTKSDYAHIIARTPEALRIHVQRIILYAQAGDPSVIGALLDLFLVLDNRGISLRRRMLALARPLISNPDYHALRLQLEHGNRELSFQRLRSPTSVLCRGVAGTTRVIEKRDT